MSNLGLQGPAGIAGGFDALAEMVAQREAQRKLMVEAQKAADEQAIRERQIRVSEGHLDLERQRAMQPGPDPLESIETVDEHGNPVTRYEPASGLRGRTFAKYVVPKPSPEDEDARTLRMKEAEAKINARYRAPRESEDLTTYERKKQIDAKYQGARGSIGQERTNLGFYNRAQQADQLINEMEPIIANQDLLSQARMQYAPNVMQSETQQSYRQAQRTFTEARLRKESGANITATEYENDSKTYFAQPGDSPALIAQKKRARQTVLNGLKIQAGRAYQEYYGDGAAPSAPEATPPAAPKRGTYNPATGKIEYQ